MRHTILPLLLVLSAAPALAGPHLRWNACEGDPGATGNQAFACNTNSGSERIVASWWVPDSIQHVTAAEVVIDLAFDTPTVPDWWSFHNTGSCRRTGLGFNLTPLANTSCVDYWTERGAAGAIVAYQAIYPDRRRLLAVAAVPAASEFAIGPHTGEMFGFNLLISHASTIGTGACAGCSVPVCIGFTQLRFERPVPLPYVTYSGVYSQDNDWFVTWQGPSSPANGGCPLATPVRNQTWGSIKATYR